MESTDGTVPQTAPAWQDRGRWVSECHSDLVPAQRLQWDEWRLVRSCLEAPRRGVRVKPGGVGLGYLRPIFAVWAAVLKLHPTDLGGGPAPPVRFFNTRVQHARSPRGAFFRVPVQPAEGGPSTEKRMRSLVIVGAMALLSLLTAVPVGAQDEEPDPPATEVGFIEELVDQLQSALRMIREIEAESGEPLSEETQDAILASLLAGLRQERALTQTAATPQSIESPEPQPIVPPLPQCTTAASSDGCWMPTENQDRDCYVWNPGPEANESAVWEGECRGGKGHGYGTLRWKKPERESGDDSEVEKKEWLRAVGVLEDGLPYGYWSLSYIGRGVEIEAEYLRGGLLSHRTQVRSR